MELMPLLKAAKDAGEEARVVSVLASGHGGKPNLEDPGLKKTYSVRTVASAAPLYNDLMVQVGDFFFACLLVSLQSLHDYIFRNSLNGILGSRLHTPSRV